MLFVHSLGIRAPGVSPANRRYHVSTPLRAVEFRQTRKPLALAKKSVSPRGKALTTPHQLHFLANAPA
jgi:hypothetical protein